MAAYNRNICLVFSLFLLLFWGCKEKDCHKDGTCAPDYRKMPLGEAKSYLWALPGSYWIYKNTANGFLDTQVCTGFLCDTIIVKGEYKDTKHITVEYERINRFISSSFNDWTIHEETAGYNGNYPRELKAIVARYANGGEIKAFFYPFNIGERNGTGSSYTTCKGMDSSMLIQGKTFSNVIKFDVDKDDIWDDKLQCIRSNNIYYWAKDVGLIKKEMKTCNSSWELIEYNIIR